MFGFHFTRHWACSLIFELILVSVGAKPDLNFVGFHYEFDVLQSQISSQKPECINVCETITSHTSNLYLRIAHKEHNVCQAH